ncbi:hypothetical protein GGR50DRAFT_589319 [Xylaria sp. CBS 124048]|nr:hypothetical protein GGR50DRAFT_589319 [Xylaria sp. CBS 124048]
MADAPAWTSHITWPPLNANLNQSLSRFASNFMKQKLESLAKEYDRSIERQFLPRLLAVVREIDEGRAAFEAVQRDAARELRDQMGLLRCAPSQVDDAVKQLETVAPRYLTAIPSASHLTALGSGLAATSMFGTLVPSNRAAARQQLNKNGHNRGSVTFMAPLVVHTQMPLAQNTITAATGPPVLEHQASSSSLSSLGSSLASFSERPTPAQNTTRLSRTDSPSLSLNNQRPDQEVIVITDSDGGSDSSKRSGKDHHDGDVPNKRQKTANEENTSDVDRSRTARHVAFENLNIGERVFRHAEKTGYFIIRCNYCVPGTFIDPPFDEKNRALTHFRKHSDATSGNEELTNEMIFEKFSHQVDGVENATRHGALEHLGATPHTFIPAGSSSKDPSSIDAEEIKRRRKTIHDPFTPVPSHSPRKLRNSSQRSGRQSQSSSVDFDFEPEVEVDVEVPEKRLPRRTPRNIPRPDYAEMVANKDPWSVPEAEVEKTTTAPPPPTPLKPVVRSGPTKRRLTKPGIRPRAEIADLNKPFGYMAEQWPRRSAPR